MEPLPVTPEHGRTERLLTKVFRKWFKTQRRAVVRAATARARRAVLDASEHTKLAKGAGGTVDPTDVKAILDALPKGNEAEFVKQLAPQMSKLTAKQALAALAQVDQSGVGVAVDMADQDAVDWAYQRAAVLVTHVNQTTREGIKDLVTLAEHDGWSNQELAKRLDDFGGFGEARSILIARTETQFASNAGALVGYRASGVVEQKEWLVAQDEVCDECEEMDGQVVGLDDVFECPSTGDMTDAPPLHPNCRCTVLPVLPPAEEGEGEQTADDEEQTAAPEQPEEPEVTEPPAPPAVPLTPEETGEVRLPPEAKPTHYMQEDTSAAVPPGSYGGPLAINPETGKPFAGEAFGPFAPPEPPPPPPEPPTVDPTPANGGSVTMLQVKRRDISDALAAEDYKALHADWKDSEAKWRSELGAGMSKAIGSYQGSGFDDINTALRSGDPVVGALSVTTKNLTKAINLAEPLDRDYVAWRGFSYPEMAQDPARFIGTVYKDEGFVSTSLEPATSLSFTSSNPDKGVLMRISIPAGTPAPYLMGGGTNGTSAWEYELLLNRGAQFQITNAYKTQDGYSVVEAIYQGSKGRTLAPRASKAELVEIGKAKASRARRFVWSADDVKWLKPPKPKT